MPEPRVPPSRARVRLAHRAGLRPSSPWLVPSTLCLGLAAALPELGAGLREGLRAGLVGGDETHGLWAMSFETGSIGLVAAAGLAVAAVAAAGGVGRVRRGRLGRVGEISGPSVALGVAALVALVVILRGVVAGAARAVDASEVGLVALWGAWLQRGLVAVGAIGLVAAIVDLARARAAIRRALRQTPAEAREFGA